MKRILLKISGEAFSGETGAIDMVSARRLGVFLEYFFQKDLEIAIVIGGGNIYRGSKLIAEGLNASDSHCMSMLSTVFNAVTLKNILEEKNIESIVLDALHVEFLQDYTSEKGKKYLREKKIVILSSGTGNPFFTTDTNAVLRALELQCEAVIKLTKVDGVYTKDPMKYDDAQYIAEISPDDFLRQDLKIFDQTGIIMARDAKLPIYVTQLDDKESLENILTGKKSGSKIF